MRKTPVYRQGIDLIHPHPGKNIQVGDGPPMAPCQHGLVADLAAQDSSSTAAPKVIVE